MELYVLYDRVAMESGPVFEAKNEAVALRKYLYFRDENGLDEKDFMLLRVGEIDHELNKVKPVFPAVEVIPNVENVMEYVEDETT